MEAWKIPKLEERLKRIKDLKEKIKNPPENQLLKPYRAMVKRYKELVDSQIKLYATARKDILEKHMLLQIKTTKHICTFGEGTTKEGNPKVRYFLQTPAGEYVERFEGVISKETDVDELTPEDFMFKLMNGEGLALSGTESQLFIE